MPLSNRWRPRVLPEQTGLAKSPTFARSFHKITGLCLDPGNENPDLRVGQQGLHRIELPRKFGFGQQGMNLPVANPVQELGVSATLGLGYEVVGVALARRNDSFAQGTDQFLLGWHRSVLQQQSPYSAH